MSINTIRAYAQKNGFIVIGKLTRHPEWEYIEQVDGTHKSLNMKSYSDEAGNQYDIGKKGIVITTAEGDII